MIEQLRRNLLWVIYALALLIAGAVINYFTWSNGEETANGFSVFLFVIVVLLYLPFVLLTRYADWQFKEFGLVVNGGTFLVALLLTALSLFVTAMGVGTGFLTSLIEAIARTGEELFFRGFVYALVIRVFANRKMIYTHLWAIMLSSLAFVVVHTQTFLPASNDTMLSILLFSLFLGSVRSLTGSILPGIILHLLFNTHTIIVVILGCVIYGLFVFWAYQKGEDVFD